MTLVMAAPCTPITTCALRYGAMSQASGVERLVLTSSTLL
eukprot:CAMPEP_0184998328 /NCGR_PEP_ID=MMETSP1098-20130426/61966_1 /TAXON_ID=89044 /ORGANISM="Spumella elongata, Strain CCAP 955/1" /LENGTH=39 /DNA_ID= /DNA_START= /DNA_END= /DNA_ORIENTATION=